MILDDFRPGRLLFAVLVALSLVACGGGGGGDGGGNNNGGDGGDGGNTPPPPTAADCSGSGSVTVSGTVNYEFVPAVRNGGGAFLDFDNSEFRPIRGAEIVAVCPDDTTQEYDSDILDVNGGYSLSVPQDVEVQLRVPASLQQSGAPGWDVEVVDNTDSQAIWVVVGETFDSGSANLTVNLNAASGWGGSAYTGARAAAPFAVLDSVYIAMQRVLEADPDAVFPPLKLNWSPDNAACSGTTFPFANGCINTSFFANFGGSAGFNIFILGDAGNDTDEYDNHVVIHEWGHYYESAFSRSDSIGGFHSDGDELDMRVAFGEGWGNAWSAIATDDSFYVDTRGTDSDGFWFDVENEAQQNPGWWNETSVQEIVYDLYDNTPGEDIAALGFAPIHAVLTGSQKTTAAMTSIFPLIHFLKSDPDNVGAIASINDVVTSQDIATITDEWGDNRTANDDGSEFTATVVADAEKYITPIHDELTTTEVNAAAPGTPLSVCTTNAFKQGGENEHNRLGARRFLRFMVDPTGVWEVTLANPGGAPNDPDFFIYNSGTEITDSTQKGVPDSGIDDSSADGIETATVTLTAGTQYVIEVVEFLNVDDDLQGPTGDDVCLDLSFEKL